MTAAAIILLVLKVSIVLTVFAIGLHADIGETTYLFRRRGMLIRSVLSMNVVMLALAMVLVEFFNLHPAVEVGLVALALSPVPPFLPIKVLKAGGKESYTIGLLAGAAVLSILVVPLSLALLARTFDRTLEMPLTTLAKLVFISVLLPLLVGISVRAFAPAFAARIVKPLSLGAMLLLIAGALPVLVSSWSTIWSLVGNGTLLAFIVFAVVGLVAGHLLAGPPLANRTVLALCTTMRHPGVAIAMAQINFSHQKLAMPAILLYMLVATVVTIPYLQWIKWHHHAIGKPKNEAELKQAS